MSIATSLTALDTAKTDIAAAITAKGGTVNSGDGFSDFATDIGTISGSPDGYICDVTVTASGNSTITLSFNATIVSGSLYHIYVRGDCTGDGGTEFSLVASIRGYTDGRLSTGRCACAATSVSGSLTTCWFDTQGDSVTNSGTAHSVTFTLADTNGNRTYLTPTTIYSAYLCANP